MKFLGLSLPGQFDRFARRGSALIAGIGRFSVGFLLAFLLIGGFSIAASHFFGATIQEDFRIIWILVTLMCVTMCGAATHRLLDSKRIKRDFREESEIILENTMKIYRYGLGIFFVFCVFGALYYLIQVFLEA